MINRKLLKKYNKPVPRYTSYPPANLFSDDFGADDYLLSIDQSNQWDPQNISLYFHIPFCKKMCYFCGCNSYALRKDEVVDAYVKAMIQEIKIIFERIDKSRLVSQIHFGGGTPNAIPIRYLQKINELLFSTFRFIENPEIAIECNPAYFSEEQISDLKKAGFKRFSLGVQDFDPSILKAVNREMPAMQLNEIISLLKDGQEDISVNLDFIYGLPGQNAESFAHTIQKAIELKPERLVTFSYAHVPWVSKIQNKIEKLGLPDNDEKIKMFEESYQQLTTNGYRSIGMDHYALENDELSVAQAKGQLHRNFQGYCTRRTTGQVYAFGVTGISQLEHAYAQNTKSIDEYIERIENGNPTTIKGYKLSKNESIIREVITELMCNGKIHWKELSKRLGIASEEIKAAIHFQPQKLKEFSEDGIIHLSEDNIEITEEGQLFIRNVAASFDPLIQFGQNKFSKPV